MHPVDNFANLGGRFVTLPAPDRDVGQTGGK